jgi:hypothetical protein
MLLLRYGLGMTASDVIAALSLVLAVISLLWQFVRSRFDKPKIVLIGGAPRSTGILLTNEVKFDAIVINVGGRPVTVTGVRWEIGRGIDQMDELPWHEQPYMDAGPTLPFRLEPYDSHTWAIWPKGTDDGYWNVHALVDVVHRPSWLETWRMRRADRKTTISVGVQRAAIRTHKGDWTNMIVNRITGD